MVLYLNSPKKVIPGRKRKTTYNSRMGFLTYIILASAGVSTGILSKIHMTTIFLTPLTTVLCKRTNNNYHNNNNK